MPFAEPWLSVNSFFWWFPFEFFKPLGQYWPELTVGERRTHTFWLVGVARVTDIKLVGPNADEFSVEFVPVELMGSEYARVPFGECKLAGFDL